LEFRNGKIIKNKGVTLRVKFTAWRSGGLKKFADYFGQRIVGAKYDEHFYVDITPEKLMEFIEESGEEFAIFKSGAEMCLMWLNVPLERLEK
jgi:hypothetical protein